MPKSLVKGGACRGQELEDAVGAEVGSDFTERIVRDTAPLFPRNVTFSALSVMQGRGGGHPWTVVKIKSMQRSLKFTYASLFRLG